MTAKICVGQFAGSHGVRGLVKGATEPTQEASAQAHNALADLISTGQLRHGNQPALNTAVSAARWKPHGDTRLLDRKGHLDISPLDAAALAVHTVMAAPASSPPAPESIPSTSDITSAFGDLDRVQF